MLLKEEISQTAILVEIIITRLIGIFLLFYVFIDWLASSYISTEIHNYKIFSLFYNFIIFLRMLAGCIMCTAGYTKDSVHTEKEFSPDLIRKLFLLSIWIVIISSLYINIINFLLSVHKQKIGFMQCLHLFLSPFISFGSPVFGNTLVTLFSLQFLGRYCSIKTWIINIFVCIGLFPLHQIFTELSKNS